MNKPFEEILDQCIQQIRAGKSVEDCLAGYSPELAAELRPLLSAASQVIRIPAPVPCPAAYDQGRQKMLAKLAEKQASAPVSLGLLARYTQRIRTFFDEKEYQDMRFISRFAIASLIVVMVGGLFATVSVSASSLPGDSLYPIKRNLEEVRLLLTTDETAKEQVQQQLQSARIQEIDELHKKGRVATLDFDGIIQSISGDTWTVNGFTLKLGENTKLVGDCVVGAIVRVTVQVQSDGSLLLIYAVARKPLPTPVQTAQTSRTLFPTPTSETGTAKPTRPSEYRPTPTGETGTTMPTRPFEYRPTPTGETGTAMPTRPFEYRPTPTGETGTAMPTRPSEYRPTPTGPTPNSATQTVLPPRPTEPGRPTLTVPTFPYPAPLTPTDWPTPNGATQTAHPTRQPTPNGETRTSQPTKMYWSTPTRPAYPPPATPMGPYPTIIATRWVFTPVAPMPTRGHPTNVSPHEPTVTPVVPVAPTATPVSPYPAPVH